MKKKLTLIATAVALGALVVVGATMAYFTSQDTATNVMTVGNVKVEIQERLTDNDEYVVKTGGEGLNIGENIVAGAELGKQVRFNVPSSSNPAYIRAKVTPMYYDLVKKEYVTDIDPVICNLPTNTSVEEGKTGWFVNDGWYYYSEAVEKSYTSNLFETVTIPTTWTNAQSNIKVEIKVDVQAVQSQNMTGGVLAAFEAAKADLEPAQEN